MTALTQESPAAKTKLITETLPPAMYEVGGEGRPLLLSIAEQESPPLEG